MFKAPSLPGIFVLALQQLAPAYADIPFERNEARVRTPVSRAGRCWALSSAAQLGIVRPDPRQDIEVEMMMKEEVFSLDRLATPLGDLLVVTDERERLRASDFWEYEPRMHRLLRLHYGDGGVLLRRGAAPIELRARLEDYFAGALTAMDDIEVMTGGTDFQREVWAALRTIRAGETRSYGELAARLGRPRAVRAVGLANGANPVTLIVPCHRVLGSNKSLTGYGGGLERKRWLLTHEGALDRIVEKARGAAGA